VHGRVDAGEDRPDDLLLVPEVVVEVPGADAEVLGDVIGRDVPDAARVEERDRRLEDPVAVGAADIGLEYMLYSLEYLL